MAGFGWRVEDGGPSRRAGRRGWNGRRPGPGGGGAARQLRLGGDGLAGSSGSAAMTTSGSTLGVRHSAIADALRKCLHQYFYLDHPIYGPMHVRVQTWAAVPDQGRLQRPRLAGAQLDDAGIGYLKKDNTFIAIEDFERAQALLEAQLQVNWPIALDELVRRVPSGPRRVDARLYPVGYYWSVEQSEWATDVVFRSPADLGGAVSPAGASWDHHVLQPGRAAVLAAEGPGEGGSRDVRRGGGQRPEAPPRGGADQARATGSTA